MTKQLFMEMLSFARPAWTAYEEAFITRYITPLNPTVDGFGNQIVDVGSNPTTLFSSHTDTVHFLSGLQDVEQVGDWIQLRKPTKVVPIGSKKDKKDKKDKKPTPHKFSAWKRDPQDNGCLGADCTTGVYIMIEMIKAGVPGRYVFHRAEEIGCLGSHYIADKTPELLKGITAAIAFDRKSTTEVITTQGYRTASDAFAVSLANMLDLGLKPSPNGTVTDTKCYSHLIPECTNLAVGYENAHSTRERQNWPYLELLVEAMKKFDASKLVIERKAEAPPQRSYGGLWGRHQEPRTIYDLVLDYPSSATKVLERHGFTFEKLKAEIDAERNKMRSSSNFANWGRF